MEWCVVALDTGDLAIFNEWHGTDAGEVLVGEIADILLDVEADGEGVGGYWARTTSACSSTWTRTCSNRFWGA